MKTGQLSFSLAAILVLLMASGCGEPPPEVHAVIFEQSKFSRPFSIDPGEQDGAQVVEQAKRQRIDRGFLPKLWLTRYSNFDSKLLTFLVQKDFSYVECVPITNRFGTKDECFVVHTDKVKALERVAHRELVSIDYKNKYDTNVLGTPIKVFALTFTYRIKVDIPELPPIDQSFKGEGKAVLNPDNGKWELADLTLGDGGNSFFLDFIHNNYEPFDLATMARRDVANGATSPKVEGQKTSKSTEELNNELSEVIKSNKFSTDEKISKIEQLLASGADINAPSPKHTMGAVEAVIYFKDTRLLEFLISKGMRVNALPGGDCNAYYAVQDVLSPGGRRMLDVLLANGLDLSCIKEPIVFRVTFGIALPTWDPENAIQAIELMKKWKINIQARDYKGRTLLEYLNAAEPGIKPHFPPFL